MTASEQARADAMADAETLYMNTDPYFGPCSNTRTRLHIGVAIDQAAERGSSAMRLAHLKQLPEQSDESFLSAVQWFAYDAARAAFRAVPGLRGEDMSGRIK